MALVIPQMSLKSELPGATAQRWWGKPELGISGEPGGGVRWPPSEAPKAKGCSRSRPRDNTRVKGERPGRRHEGGPKQGQDPTAQ